MAAHSACFAGAQVPFLRFVKSPDERRKSESKLAQSRVQQKPRISTYPWAGKAWTA